MTGISRGEFLKLVAKIPLTTIGVGLGVAAGEKAGDEIAVVKQEMFESDGVWYQPIYEVHGEGPKTTLNPGADGVFIELNAHSIEENGEQGENQYTMNPDRMLKAFADIPEVYSHYQELARRQIPVAIGDVVLSGRFAKESDLNRITDPNDVRDFYAGIGIALAGLVTHAGFNSAGAMTRRDFLKRMGFLGLATTLAGAWKASGTGSFKNLLLAGPAENLEKQYEPINRLLIRLQGLASDTHPDSPLIFMRNLIMARKIKIFGEYLKKKGIQNPIEGYNVGVAHGGIEDFICLPNEVSTYLIKYCARDYLNRVISFYGDFAAATRIVQADETGIFRETETLYDFELLDELNKE